MDIYTCQEAFGAADKTSRAMRDAIKEWFDLYYRDAVQDGEDPCQRIAYTVVSKLVRGVFAELNATCDAPGAMAVIQALDKLQEKAVALALVGGECYIKPWPDKTKFDFTLIPRNQALIFARDPAGEPTDAGTMERSTLGNAYFTLLERRKVDENGFLTIENKLFRSFNESALGGQVPLTSHPLYSGLAERYTYEKPLHSVGLVRVKTPMLNCVDGSADGVSVYGAAAGLIHAIDRNEHQLKGEFDRGESRVFVSSDLLDNKTLKDNLFVGLDESPQQVGITLFSPQLREQSFLNRKQEYLRNVESLIGLRRGLLCDVNLAERTATEISSSQTEHALTLMDFQGMWQRAVEETLALCVKLGAPYGIVIEGDKVAFDWGNGILYDEEKRWQDYKEMVASGLLRPEVALGWRFGLPAQTAAQQALIREKFMPEGTNG